MISKVQGVGITERLLYGAVGFLVMKFGARWGLSPDDVPWIVGGGIALVGGTRAWWVNRPTILLNDAASSAPKNSQLAIIPMAAASNVERAEMRALADASNEKVVSKA